MFPAFIFPQMNAISLTQKLERKGDKEMEWAAGSGVMKEGAMFLEVSKVPLCISSLASFFFCSNSGFFPLLHQELLIKNEFDVKAFLLFIFTFLSTTHLLPESAIKSVEDYRRRKTRRRDTKKNCIMLTG